MRTKTTIAAFAAVLWLAGSASAQTPAAAPPVAPKTIYKIEMLQIAKPSSDIMDQLKPLKTLGQVEGMLKAHDVPFAWRKAEVTNVMLGAMEAQLSALPRGEPFVIPDKEGRVMIGVIVDSRPAR